ncbi:uncharacterized protein A1O9_04393 [Exophiala aquamarina CBS 119918]|uniref:Cytochrome P450 oxidoreductase n=1 Tax=Exophiala aquamarina CBS 119918 TaxID=1182545 RepID=A0A072PHD3_9EURO|nr:uncharacterized protein A1O9_04393 [Exophiala aquamarina CBS 119918]KEF59549.1 hypothetical protein A1O9_04393 [Exophiala aquamarina CBS 119918]
MAWTLSFVVAAVATILLYLYQSRPRIHRDGKSLRRPPNTLPVLGNALHFLKPRRELFSWFVRCQQIFGSETFEISVPSLPPGVVINSPENLDFVLKNEASISKGEFFRERSWDLFGYGIINSTGDLWKAQRKAGLKFFGGATLDSMVEDVLPEVYLSETGMRQQLLQAVKDNSVVDMQKLFLDLTTTVVGYMAYDMEISSTHPFSKAFDHASNQIGLRFQNPLYKTTELFTGSAFRSSIAEVKRFGREIVRNARKRRAQAAFESLITQDDSDASSGGEGSRLENLIDSLMETFENPTIVADAALNFLSAGRDTTAQSLTWTLYALLRNPEALPQLRREIDPTFSRTGNGKESKKNANDDTGPQITVSNLQPLSLPHTLAVFHESLRLYPPVPIEIKQTLQPLTLPDGTTLPTDAVVVWCIWALNRSEKTFGADAAFFRPERWIDGQGKLLRRSEAEYPVFNGGPRACLGRKMAEVLACWVLGMVLVEFEFVEVGGLDGEPGEVGEESKGSGECVKERVSANSLTLPMEGGLPCRVSLR